MPVLLVIAVTTALSLAAAQELPWLGLPAAAEDFFVTLAAAPSVSMTLRRGRGRPRKFAAPSRAITLTLPDAVLSTLAEINGDPSRAIVQLVKQRAPRAVKVPLAELAVFGRRAVIVIKPTASLEQRTGIELVPLPDGRALLSFDQSKSIADFELRLYDALETPDLAPEDRKIFQAIGDILKDARRAHDVSLFHRSIIVLESTNGTAKASNGGATRFGRRKARK